MNLVLVLSLFFFYYLFGGSRCDHNKGVRKRQVILMGFSLFIFAALRSYEVGTDLPSYFSSYQEDGSMSLRDILYYRQGRDPFFHLFLHVLYQVSPNPQLMLVTIGAVVALGFSYLAYHEKGNVLLIYMLFVGLRMYSFTLSGLRQAMALGIVFIAYVMLRKKRYGLYFALTLFAVLFHTSALIFILAYPIHKIKNTPLFIVVTLSIGIINLVAGGLVADILRNIAFEERFDSYDLNREFQGGMTFVIYFIVFVFTIGMYKTMKIRDASYPESLRMATLGFVLVFIGQTVENVFRLAYYFNYASILIIPQLIDGLMYNKISTKAAYFIVAFIFAAQYLILGTGPGTENYSFFWEVPTLV